MYYSDNFKPTMSDDEVFQKIESERDTIGYYSLVSQDLGSYKEYAKNVKQQNILVVGIGGSTLGTSAIYDFLKYTRVLSKKFYFLESTDPVDIISKVDGIDLKDTLFIVISKSGTTVETISIFKYLHSLVQIDKSNLLIITESDSKLNHYAKINDIRTFEIPKNIGGRFSVFSAVGLVPLSIIGVDIDEILEGVKSVHNSFFQQKLHYKKILKKARFFTEYKHKFNINVVFSYSSSLDGFNKWYIQLWGESLGKVDISSTRQGLTPIGIIGPIDQHSFLQLIVEGKRDKTVTVIKINNFKNNLKIPSVKLEGLEDLDYLDELKFSKLITMQADATIESINNLKDIPCDVVTIDSINEKSIASLMYEYELLTSVCAKFMYINAYDQPGVEAGKIILKEKLKG